MHQFALHPPSLFGRMRFDSSHAMSRREGDQDGWWPVSSEIYRRGEVFGVGCRVFASC